MKILIGADFVPTETNEKSFIYGDVETLIGKELYNTFENADFKVFNLEIPFAYKKTPIKKWGPALSADPRTIELYKRLKIDLLILANNHIMDQGLDGFRLTIDTLNNSKIDYIGGLKSINNCEKPYICEIEKKKIGFYACAEHEFSIASTDMPGANPFDYFNSYKSVKELKENSDYVVVLYHGGKEHYRYPSPELQRRCRRFIQEGADLVVCQHSHCIGCYEEYKEKNIVYGQGNFLFDYKNDECWRTGLLIEICDDFKIKYIPIVKNNESIKLASEGQSKQILEEFEKRSKKVIDDSFIDEQYKQYANGLLDDYLWILCGASNSFVLKALNKISHNNFSKIYLKHRFKKKGLLAIQNYFECEAHRELIINALKTRNN